MAKSKVENENVSVLIERVDTIKENIGKIGEEVQRIEEKIEERYISKIEFYAEISPIKKIVYTLVGSVLISFIGALLSLVFIR